MRGHFERLRDGFVRFEIWRNQHGQDLVEYSLMAGFVATAAGALMPHVAGSISTIMSKISSVMSGAATQSNKHTG